MTEHEQIEAFHKEYLSLKDNTPMMKRDGEECKAYHKWYDSAYVYFKSIPSLQKDPDFQVFVNADKEGNCFVLEHIYDSISPSYKVLMLKTEKMNNVDGAESAAKSPLVFISHSSNDKTIIDSFVDNVLILGLGLGKDDIVFTSNEVYGVEPGDNISRYINENIKAASVVLLMISSEYRQSEMCLNEMGAAWALGKAFIPVLLPDAGYDKVGWLINLHKAIKVNQKEQVVSLCEEIVKLLKVTNIEGRLAAIYSYTDKFIASITTASASVAPKVAKALQFGNIDNEVSKAIFKLGEFSIKELQKETEIQDYHYLMEKVNAMVFHGELVAIGSKDNRRYRIKLQYYGI